MEIWDLLGSCNNNDGTSIEKKICGKIYYY
jgi:hypothetical protein